MNGESRTKNVFRNATFGMLYKVVTLLLPFVTRTLLLFLIGVSSAGISTLFSSILSFLSLAELGFGSAVVYSMYKPIAENDIKTVSALLKFYKKLYRIIGAVILVLGIAIMPLLPKLMNGEAPEGINIYYLYLIYLLNTVISYFAAGYMQSLLVAHQRADIKDKIAIVVTLFVRVAEIAVIVLVKDLYAYALVAVLGTVLTNILTAVLTKKMYPDITCKGQITKEQKDSIIKKISGLLGTKLNAIIIHQADTLVVSAFFGLTVLAKYGNYYYVLNAVSGFIMFFFSAMTPSVGNKIVTSEKAEVKQTFRKISFINDWIVGFCAICLLCLYQPFIELWVGKKLMLPFEICVLMALYLYVYEIQRTILVFKDAAGLWYEDRLRPYVSMIFNVVVNIILVQVIGLSGVVISTILAFAISIPWCNYTVFKHLFKEKALSNLLRMIVRLLFVIAVGALTLFVCSFTKGGLVGLIERGIICLIVPNAIFFLTSFRTEEFKFFKNMILRKLKLKKS